MTQPVKTVDAEGLRKLLEAYPGLTANGMEGPHVKHFKRFRADMFTDSVLQEVNHCIAFLAAFTPTKTPTTSSYSLKHRAEDWGVGGTTYIHNGSAIAAGILLGLPARFDDLNPSFGISKPEIDWVYYKGKKPWKGSRIRQPRGWDAFLSWRSAQS